MSNINIKTGKDIIAKELTALRCSVNLAQQASCTRVEQAIDAYPFTAQARNAADELIGYVSAFSDEVFVTMVGELLVHPDYQRRGIGTALLKRVVLRYPGTPIQAYSFDDALPFFTRQGYVSSEQVKRVILDNRTAMNESVIAWATA